MENNEEIKLTRKERLSYVLQLRILQKLTDNEYEKKDLEEMAGVSHYVMNKLVHGENVTTDILGRICRALDCSLDDIMEFTDD